ncbi:MAG: hypothetical protein RBT33_01345 [Candidatus Dojkabacteria bacterium]|jgi:hypothetical protein|nr:hypothetical protein [Candidatus Dojkabacteria bacterium]
MKYLKILLLPILFFSLTTILSAQDQEVVVDKDVAKSESLPIVNENPEKKTVTSKNNYFELELIRGTQSALTKNIPYTLYITPKIDSQKTQILWEVPSTILVKRSHKEFVSLNKDETYKFKINVDPQRAGTYDVSASVISWQYDTNYTNSVSSTVTLSDNLVVQPVDSEYSVSIMLMVALVVILAGIGVFLLYKASGKLIKKLKLWLTPPF